jgi:hypothetical protein
MRYIDKKPASEDRDKFVYQFAFGIEELTLLNGILKDFRNKTPRIFEFSIPRNRVKNMISRLDEFFRAHKN